ncbi:hypothetical protein N7523_007909 [Penicillium sp. IBT 18751x]|nr:hypothetical protein N7523_007909 [Penicillium sp. IBT 18751x]
MKRKIESLEDDRELLLQLVSNVRGSSNRQVIQLLNLIRSNAPLGEIKDYMDKTRIMRDSTAQPRRSVMDVRKLSDDPLWKVPAKPWTRVSDDDEFVSHLVSLWFTWYHPYFNFMDRDRFIRDMQSGDTESALYCSPFLVNAILADACAYSDYPEAFANLGDLPSKGQHFYTEAKDLYEKEDGQVTLTTIHGLCILFSSACMNGKDRRGWLYQGQLAFVVDDLIEQHDLGKESIYAPEVVNLTVWGLYSITAATSLIFHKRPLIRAPKIPYGMHPSPRSDSSDIWIPYPSLVGGVPAHTASMVKALADLNIATFESSSSLFKGPIHLEKMSFLEVRDAVGELHARLEAWKINLQDCMREKNNKTPHALGLHMYWNQIIMSINGYVEKKGFQEDLDPREYQSVRNVRLAAARKIASLAEVHRAAWGYDRVTAGDIQSFSMAESTLLEDLDNPESQKAFVNLCIASKAAARRWPIGKAMLRAIQMAAKELGVTLPSETDALFSDLEGKWTSRKAEDISSLYPNFAIYLRSKKNDEAELDRFLEKWDALHIAE